MRIYIFFLMLFITNKIYCQTDTVASLKIISGSSLTMHFNSLDKITNGIEYLNWTRLNANFTATSLGFPTAARWRLSVRSNTANIVGDNGHILDTRTVRVLANSGGQGINTGWQALTNSDVILVTNGNNPVSSAPILISYDCGRNAGFSISGASTDYYVVDLIFTFELIP